MGTVTCNDRVKVSAFYTLRRVAEPAGSGRPRAQTPAAPASSSRAFYSECGGEWALLLLESLCCDVSKFPGYNLIVRSPFSVM